MSHYALLAILDDVEPKRHAVESALLEALEPFSEDGKWFRVGSRLDWWQIGGRYTGVLDGYAPETDPANREVCNLCGGTGQRDWSGLQVTEDWIRRCNGCNGCKGSGFALKWSTEWVPHDGDVALVRDITTIPSPFLPTAVLTPDGVWHEMTRVGWWGASIPSEPDAAEFFIVTHGPDGWPEIVRKLLGQHPDSTGVVVDCHV